MKSIPGGKSQLQSCPSECADRVCLRHSGASVTHPGNPHHAAQDRMKPALLNQEHTSFTKCMNIKNRVCKFCLQKMPFKGTNRFGSVQLSDIKKTTLPIKHL